MRPAAAVLLVLTVCMVYVVGLQGGFIFDDFHAIVENPAYAGDFSRWPAWCELLQWSDATIGRPLANATFALNFATGGGTWGMKATNLAIHALNALFAWHLLARLCNAARASTAPLHRAFPFLVAATWALHPLQVSTVLYVVQRMELLAFGFTLAALAAYWQAREAARPSRRLAWAATCAALVALGYQAKETVALVPAYILLIEWALPSKAASTAWRGRQATVALVVVLLVFIALVAWTSLAGPWDNRAFTPAERGWTQLRALGTYLLWSLWPDPRAYTFFHDTFAVSRSLLEPPSTLAAALVLSATVLLAVAIRRHRPLVALGIGWFFIAHAITSAPLNLELVFEHRNYPALLGVMLAVGDLAWAAMERLQVKNRMRVPVAAAVVFALAGLTAMQAATWGHPARLAVHLAEVNPQSPRAQLNLARTYAHAAGADAGSPWVGPLLQTLERAAALPGASPLAEVALLRQSRRLGVQPLPGWRASLLDKLRDGPTGSEMTSALQQLGNGLVSGELDGEVALVVAAYRIAIGRQPASAAWRAQLGDVYLHLGDGKRAAACWESALSLMQASPARRASVARRFAQAGHAASAHQLARARPLRYPRQAAPDGMQPASETLPVLASDIACPRPRPVPHNAASPSSS